MAWMLWRWCAQVTEIAEGCINSKVNADASLMDAGLDSLGTVEVRPIWPDSRPGGTEPESF